MLHFTFSPVHGSVTLKIHELPDYLRIRDSRRTFRFTIFYFLGVDARGLRDQRARHWFEDCMDSHHHLCKLHRRAGLFFCARFTAEKIKQT